MSSLRTLLAVEDSDEDFDTIEAACSAWSRFRPERAFKLVRAISAEDCVARLTNSGEALPHLLLMDLNMPGAGGASALKTIKLLDNLKAIPVVMLSSSTRECDITTCQRNGASAYMVKPFHYKEFMNLMESFFDYWSRTASWQRT